MYELFSIGVSRYSKITIDERVPDDIVTIKWINYSGFFKELTCSIKEYDHRITLSVDNPYSIAYMNTDTCHRIKVGKI